MNNTKQFVTSFVSQGLWFLSYFSCGSDSLPDTEVAEDPGQEKTQGQLPLYVSQILYASG